MTPEQLVAPFDLCKRMRDAGFPQDTCFFWFLDVYNAPLITKGSAPVVLSDGLTVSVFCAAPTFAEIAPQLPALFLWIALRLRRWRGTIPPAWSRREIVVPMTRAGVRDATRRIADRVVAAWRRRVARDGSTG